MNMIQRVSLHLKDIKVESTKNGGAPAAASLVGFPPPSKAAKFGSPESESKISVKPVRPHCPEPTSAA